ncbi:PKD domain-containing protein, partial [Candidatus Bipolaricaulota bacterium]|nr:PKD domain-containing protein [Candidatus Bipolaricaulota bacterium]
MKNRWIAQLASIGLILLFATAAHAFEADFDPSTYNPDVAEIVNFEVCEPCLGGSNFTFSWDFDGNGDPEFDTDQDLVTYSFASAGFYEVILTVTDAGGRTSVARQGIVVGPIPAIAVRELLVESDGAIFVLLTVTMNERVSAPGIEENIPDGWAIEVVDAGGAVMKPNMEEKQYEIAWMSMFEPGETVTFSYRLRPAYTSVLPTLSGELSGYSGGERFVAKVAGMLTLPR